ncbi:MAG: hypothetical protein AB1428_14575 [Bacteroidota bacterium]
MNLEQELLSEHSRRQADRCARWVGRDRARFRKLMRIFLKGDGLLARRSAWVVGICADNAPDLVCPYLGQMIQRMEEPEIHDAVKRNVVRLLQFVEIPPHLLGRVATICFGYLTSLEVPVAVKANAMTVLAKIARKRPDLARELRLVVDQQLPFAAGAIRARARQLSKILESTLPPAGVGNKSGKSRLF